MIYTTGCVQSVTYMYHRECFSFQLCDTVLTERARYLVHLIVDQLVCEAWTWLLLLQSLARVFLHCLVILIHTRPVELHTQ